ncbi:MAG: hypothetical protein K2G26_01300 [Clostridia bacterium]|nr:hypothetical protein [Clostridia bacterium]
MKRLLWAACAAGVMLTACAAFVGCGSSAKSISSVEELYAMQSGKSYKLACDLDLQGRAWYPLSVKNFNGNGHTISNCVVTECDTKYSLTDCGGFFVTANNISNVKFDSIDVTLSISDMSFIGGIVGNCGDLSNVELTNCTYDFQITSTDNRIGYFGMIAGIVQKVSAVKVDNCKVDYLIRDTGRCELQFGGIAGRTDSNKGFTSSSIKNTEIKLENKSKYGGMNVGLIIGGFESYSGGLSDCVAENCTLEVIGNYTNEYTTRVGGIAGYVRYDTSLVANCVSADNDIEVIASYGYNIGGIVGKTFAKVENCLSDSNKLTGATSSTRKDQFAGVGGVCGTANNTVSKSVSQNNEIRGTSNTQSADMLTAGLIVNPTASVANCAVIGCTISGGHTDCFSGACEAVFNCVVAGNTVKPNVNTVEVLDEDELDSIISKLQLDANVWSFDDGKLALKV